MMIKKLFLLSLILMVCLSATELDICFTGNNRGLLDPCGCRIPAGGYARIATVQSEIKGDFLQIGTGNHFFHHIPMPNEDHIFDQMKAELQAQLMSDLNYNVINVGQFDLCYGINPLLRMKENYQLDFISANVLDKDGNQVFPSYKIIEHQGLTLMFVGICDLSDKMNYKIMDPMLRLTQLEKEGLFNEADLVILLADVTSKRLLNFVKYHSGIDIIVASKDHMFTSLPMKEKHTAFMQLGSQGKYFGKLKLQFQDPSSDWKNISVYNYYVKTNQEKLKSPGKNKKKIQRLLRAHKKKLKSLKEDYPENYSWETIFLDDLIKDNTQIKDQIEALIERK